MPRATNAHTRSRRTSPAADASVATDAPVAVAGVKRESAEDVRVGVAEDALKLSPQRSKKRTRSQSVRVAAETTSGALDGDSRAEAETAAGHVTGKLPETHSQAHNGSGSIGSEAAPVFIKKLKRFWPTERNADPARPDSCAHTNTNTSLNGDLVLNAPDSVALSDISLSNLPSLSSPSVLNAIASELQFAAAPLTSSFSSSHPDLLLLPGQDTGAGAATAPAANLQQLVPLLPHASGAGSGSSTSPGSSPSVCSACHQLKPTSPSPSCSCAAIEQNNLSIPEMLVITTAREPSAAQRQAGIDSIVVVESRRALTPGANLMVAGSNSVCSSVSNPVLAIPDNQLTNMVTNINDGIRLVKLPLNDEESNTVRQLIKNDSFPPFSGMYIQLFSPRRIDTCF